MMRWMSILSFGRSLPRDLRLLFFSLFLWTFGLGVYNYVWSLYLTQLYANPEQVGLVSSIGYVAAAISMIPGGILANKYDNRTLLIVGWAMSTPVPILFYFSRTWSDVIPGLVLFQLTAFNLPAMNSFIGQLGDQRRMSSAFGAVYSAFPLGLILSPAVGSLLLTWFSIRDLFWVTLVLWTVSTIILFPIKRQPPREVDSKAPLFELPRSRQELTILVFLFGVPAAISITSPSFLPLFPSRSVASHGRSDSATGRGSVSWRSDLCNSSRTVGCYPQPWINDREGTLARRRRSSWNSSGRLSSPYCAHGVPARRREGSELRLLLSALEHETGKIQSWPVRSLLDLRTAGLRSRLIHRRLPLRQQPHKRPHHYILSVRSSCSTCRIRHAESVRRWSSEKVSEVENRSGSSQVLREDYGLGGAGPGPKPGDGVGPDVIGRGVFDARLFAR
jgi:hypothetical protein